MQKTIILSLALVFTAAGLFAQTSATANTTHTERKVQLSPSDKAKRAIEKINATVPLTIDQNSKILPLFEDYFTKVAAVKSTDEPNMKAVSIQKPNKIKALEEELSAKLKGILSDEQVEKVKALYAK